MIYDHRRDMHDNLDAIRLYACPNLNARYTSDSLSATRWQGDYPECAVCGRTHGNFAVHHEPPRSKGSLLLGTKRGHFVVKPTLILLCAECHRDRHDRAKLSFEWVFDSEEDELAFLKGEFFKAGWKEHDTRFWELGRLIVHGRHGKEIRR